MATGGKFGPRQINPGTGRLNLISTKSGHTEPLLPHKDALARLQRGTPAQQSFLSYAKATPSGANAPVSYQDIIDMARASGTNIR